MSEAPPTHSLPADAPPTHTPPVDALPTLADTEEDKEASELKSNKLRNSVSLDEDDFKTMKDAPTYLTILRSDNDIIVRSYTDGRVPSLKPGLGKKGTGPPVPPRKRRYIFRCGISHIYSGTSKQGTCWGQYKSTCFVPCREVVLFYIGGCKCIETTGRINTI